RVTSDVVFEPLWVIAPLLLIASLCVVAGAASFRPLQKPHQQRLLRMQPILGLVPDRAVRPVDHVVGDLVTSVRRKAMQHNSFSAGPRKQTSGLAGREATEAPA